MTITNSQSKERKEIQVRQPLTGVLTSGYRVYSVSIKGRGTNRPCLSFTPQREILGNKLYTVNGGLNHDSRKVLELRGPET